MNWGKIYSSVIIPGCEWNFNQQHGKNYTRLRWMKACCKYDRKEIWTTKQ